MTTIQIIAAACNILTGFILIATGIPVLRRRIKPNHWYGFRIQKAFQSEELWYDINAYCARQLIIWSIPIIIAGIACLAIPINESTSPAILLALLCGPLTIFTIIPIAMTLLYAWKK